VTFTVSVENPYAEPMTGAARWLLDTSAFSVAPPSVALQIPIGTTHQYRFTLKALRDMATLPSLPQLEFNVLAAGRVRRFHREVRLLREAATPWRKTGPTLDGRFDDWRGIAKLTLTAPSQPPAEFASCFDAQNLYLALTVPAADAEESQELGFSDEVQIGLARRLSATDFGRDLLRLGFNSDSHDVLNRTPGRKAESVFPGARCVCQAEDHQRRYEIAIPLRSLKDLKPSPGGQLILDVAFPVPDGGPESEEPAEPGANTFSYRIRYGTDSLVPVYFVQLNLGKKRRTE
jgi:hypothetical protein